MQRAFTMVEVLIVIGILSALSIMGAAVLNPANRLNSARDSLDQENANQIAYAFKLYMIDNGGQIPQLDGGSASTVVTDSYIQTNLISANDCSPATDLNNYNDTIGNGYLSEQVMTEVSDDYEVLFSDQGSVFVCKSDSNPLVYEY